MPRHGFLASAIGLAGAASLVLAPAPSAVAAPAPASPAAAAPAAPEQAAVPGSTQSLPLVPLAPAARSHGHRRKAGPRFAQGLHRSHVRRFSLLGVVWHDPGTELRGQVQARTRSVATGRWSAWQDVDTHNADHGADPGTAERAAGRVRGATAPLWVGDSDGVDVRVRAETGRRAAPLPSGLRLELVDPGSESAPAAGAPAGQGRTGQGRTGQGRTGDASEAAWAASAANAELVPQGATVIPALNRQDTEHEMLALRGRYLTEHQRRNPYVGPRPSIVTRSGWGADESLREPDFAYTDTVKAVFVHHTATGNNYRCAESASIIRGIYRYHVKSMGWRDIGYNFLVDKCGKIYEGRAGGVAKPVMGAHTLGFNTDSTGVAVIGSFDETRPASAALKAVERLTAWKLGLYGVDPRGTTYLTSAGGNLYPQGTSARLNVISGHRDGFATTCPGWQLYARLGTIRSAAARLQGR
ncbi:peptidoglycan recognition protein [Streptomyces sp. NPDC046985]|uniref:peptidoglycan recognition protein family protein n=1 Tax=Streptomyces sp. NPDC046985 TaxID=3155377 RepID=UPI003410AC6A